MATFEDIDAARRILGLLDTASMREIKQSYRRMSFQHHPDQSDEGQEDDQTMKRLNWAYGTIVDYCERYRYSFQEEDVAMAYPEEWNWKRYVKGWF